MVSFIGDEHLHDMESKLNIEDLRELQRAFYLEGNGYGDHLSLNRAQFCEALTYIVDKGTAKEYGELFDKIDVTKESLVDWDKFASYMLLNFYEKDDRVKSTQVPQWKDLRSLKGPHKDIIQKVAYLKASSKYVAISKEGAVSLWDTKMKLQKSYKLTSDSCSVKDLWVTCFVPMYSINKVAVSFTSKEIAIYDLTTKLDFHCVYKLHGLEHIAISIDYWSHPDNANHGVLTWGDTSGTLTAVQFTNATTSLFERQSSSSSSVQEGCFIVQLSDVAKNKFGSANLLQHCGHTEWVRQVRYSSGLECFISCSTTWSDSLVLGWVDKMRGDRLRVYTSAVEPKAIIKSINRISVIQISQGINTFDYHDRLNLIATAGVNSHVCLWNPYVTSKPSGVLRGHMTSVTQVCFVRSRSQLISFSKDKVLRIWDVQLQICMQRLAGIFPKLPDVNSLLYYDERRGRLFITFNADLTVLELKPEIKDRVVSHDSPIVGAFYNQTYNQVVSASENGTVNIWMIDSGQKVKQWTDAHGPAKLTAVSPDMTDTRILTGASDGTIKVWDFNGHCHHVLLCQKQGSDHVADIGQILSLKRCIVAVGWTKYITVFRDHNFESVNVDASDWKGGKEHSDDILSVAFLGPSTLVTGAYNGEIIVWNYVSEQASRRLLSRTRFGVDVKHSLPPLIEDSAGGKGGFDSHNWLTSRPSTRPKSRAASRISLGGEDETNEFGYAVTCLAFLPTRANTNGSAANLVSCGGNGWVRFWNTSSSRLVGEFIAHEQVGSIVMAVDESCRWLATGDVDGQLKLWDISDYCASTETSDEIVVTDLPYLDIQVQLHVDMISALSFCVRNERTLIVSSSQDCSVQMYDVTTKAVVGTFGQENHWRIDPIISCDDTENSLKKEEDVPVVVSRMNSASYWEPDSRAVNDPANFRINTWQRTSLGKEYQELRVSKRERRQPGLIADLPYLQWDKLKLPAAGPHNALATSELKDVRVLEKPDFIHNPHKYFSDHLPPIEKCAGPAISKTGLQISFDEKSLFPKYILDYEAKMRHLTAHDSTSSSQPLKNIQNHSNPAPRRITCVQVVTKQQKQRNKDTQAGPSAAVEMKESTAIV